ncbi:hypothetical protein POL68_00380 [Stigmatella sp. ncwal1]|uniref:Uncharacterized protein n=1 Tax=Stigmatella ashevillensis TaxID=2995309 RepID=A0ABT5D1B4_9BACT|nr:hypothetical protein [Stigmatella ashevillena]MDC0706918.1 hypothetical protein [Stigmatella ashevillena]
MKRSLWLLVLGVPCMALGQVKESKSTVPVAIMASPKAGVDWKEGVLRATGAGAPDLRASNPAQARLGAERAAKNDAYRNLMKQLEGVPIRPGRSVGDAMAQGEVRGRVEELLRGFKTSNKRYYSDGGVEVDAEVTLPVLASVLVPASAPGIVLNKQGAKKYTGLVVDARGLGAQPVLAPQLLDASGNPVYGMDALSRRTTAVAAYHEGLDEARKSVLVGEKPLVVKAVKLQGSDLVLADEALKQLSESDVSFLAEGRVAIVTR